MSKPPKHRPFRSLRIRARETERTATFADAAKRMGVVPLVSGAARVAARKAPRKVAPPVPRSFILEQDDAWLEGYRTELGPGALRRLRGAPGATLDLHGASVASARKQLVLFLEEQRAHARALVLVIVGKGMHSAGGRAVLRDEIGAWLVSAPASSHVIAFGTAPARLGGSGGVLVALAQASE